MILYHFTCTEHLPSILKNGLNRGEVTFDFAQRPMNGVWLTSLDTPKVQGLGDGLLRPLTEAERKIMGIPPDAPTCYFPDKHAVRIKVVIKSSDRLLKPWAKWGRRHATAQTFDTMNSTAPNWRNSYIYFGTITPDKFLEVITPHRPQGSGEMAEAA